MRLRRVDDGKNFSRSRVIGLGSVKSLFCPLSSVSCQIIQGIIRSDLQHRCVRRQNRQATHLRRSKLRPRSLCLLEVPHIPFQRAGRLLPLPHLQKQGRPSSHYNAVYRRRLIGTHRIQISQFPHTRLGMRCSRSVGAAAYPVVCHTGNELRDLDQETQDCRNEQPLCVESNKDKVPGP